MPRCARRTRKVDEAILGACLAGANTRCIRRALEALLGAEHQSTSAVSRVAVRLKTRLAQCHERDLSQERHAILFPNGFHLEVRMARRVAGARMRVALELVVSEAEAAGRGSCRIHP